MGPGRQLRPQLGMTLQKLRRKIDHELVDRMVDLNDRFPESPLRKFSLYNRLSGTEPKW